MVREARQRRALARAGRQCCRLRPWLSPARARGDSSKRRLVWFVPKLELRRARRSARRRLRPPRAASACGLCACERARARRRSLSRRAAGEAPCSLAFVGETPAPSAARAREPAGCRPLLVAWCRSLRCESRWGPEFQRARSRASGVARRHTAPPREECRWIRGGRLARFEGRAGVLPARSRQRRMRERANKRAGRGALATSPCAPSVWRRRALRRRLRVRGVGDERAPSRAARKTRSPTPMRSLAQSPRRGAAHRAPPLTPARRARAAPPRTRRGRGEWHTRGACGCRWWRWS